MQKLFESKTNQAADELPNTVDAKIIINSTPYLLYYQFDLDDLGLMLGEGKRKRRRKTVSRQKGGFIAPIVAALAPAAIDLVKKLIR